MSYWKGAVQRGDVIVFRDPGGWLGPQPPLNPVQKALSTVGLYPTGGHLVKRVIGVGGDEVRCCDAEGHVTVNGVPLEEKSYIKNGSVPSTRKFDVTVPQGRLWVMGDHRSASGDSLQHWKDTADIQEATISEKSIVGRAFTVFWPVSRATWLSVPSGFDKIPDATAAK